MKKFVNRILYRFLLCAALISSGIYASVVHSENSFNPVVSAEAFDGRTHKPSIEKFPSDVLDITDFLTKYHQIVDECWDRGFGLGYVQDIASKIRGESDLFIPAINEAGVISLIETGTGESKVHLFIDYNDCSEYFSEANIETLNSNGFNIISNGDGAAKIGKRRNLVTEGKLIPTRLSFPSAEDESAVLIDGHEVSQYRILASQIDKFSHLGETFIIRFFDPRVSQYENFSHEKLSPIYDGVSIFTEIGVISVPSDAFHRGNIRGSTPTKEQIDELAPSFAASLAAHGVTEELDIKKWYEMFAHFVFEVPSKGNVLFGGLLEYLKIQGHFAGINRFALIDDSYEKLAAAKALLIARGATLVESDASFRMPNGDEIILRQYVRN